MKTRTTVLALLLSTVAIAAEPGANEPSAKIEEAILAAARSGDGAGIGKLIIQSFAQRGSLDEADVKALLDELVRSEELPAFTVLLGEMRKTNLGKDWQPDDALLDDVIRGGRQDFLDAMLASWLDPARLEAKLDAGDAAMSEWITRRTTEVRKQRAEHVELVEAAGKGDLETMRRLLDSGVDVNCIAEKERHTPLTRAAGQSQLEAVRLLLERGANVDQPKHPGWDYTPLCLTKSVAIAELLKSYGANVHAKLFKRDVSILTYMVRHGGADIVEWMLQQGLDAKMIGDNKQNLLFAAGDARTAEILLAAGVDPNAVDEFGGTPLTSAQSGDIAKRLIAAGAKPKTDETGLREMIGNYASASAIEEVIKLRGKLDPIEAQRALISAAHGDQHKIARLMLKHGAQANEPGFLGTTKDHPILPLLMCTIHGSPKTAKVLLEHGADPNAGERPGMLLENAVQNGNKEVAKILRDAGGKGVSDLAFHLAMGDAAKVSELLAIAPSYADDAAFWLRALPTAARLGHRQAVLVAIEKGVPLAAGAQENAFQAAAYEGQHEVLAELLARRGKASDAEDLRLALWTSAYNSHPYDRQRPAEAFEQCVKLLLDAGAPVTGTDERGELVTAAVFTRNPGGNPKVVEMLVAAGADPNPQITWDNKTKRLSEVIESACAEQGCSTPFARTITAVEKSAKVAIKR